MYVVILWLLFLLKREMTDLAELIKPMNIINAHEIYLLKYLKSIERYVSSSFMSHL